MAGHLSGVMSEWRKPWPFRAPASNTDQIRAIYAPYSDSFHGRGQAPFTRY